jgi:tetratricopeptide (TPR) repeat protein
MEASPAASEVALLKRPRFVGRAPELRALKEALRHARSGEGSAWILEGPEGIGKSRVARWAEEIAKTEGFEVRWGYGVREGLVPFLPFELMFRAGKKEAGSSKKGPPPEAEGAERAPIVLVEEARPRRFWSRVERTVAKGPLLVASRERPTAIRTNRPALNEAKTLLWITRLEGENNIAPGSLDALADRFEEHLRSHPGGTVALEGMEYLVSQGSFLPVLRLLQFLRDVAQETGGQVILSINPTSLEPREVSLLEAEAEVDADETPATAEAVPAAPASPSQMLLKLLSQVEESAERAPQLFVFDDLQWADLPSMRAFQFLVRNTRERPIVWIACLRTEPEEPAAPGRSAAAPSPIQDIEDHMVSEGALQRLTLRPLEGSEIRQLVEGATEVPLDVDHGDPEFRVFLERTGGNPHFALSSLRLLWEQGRVRHQGDHAVIAPLPSAAKATEPSAPSLPENLHRAAASRLGLLEPSERRFLAVAALSGKDFDLDAIADRLGRSIDDLRTLARRLEGLHGLVRPISPSGERWTFQDGTVWDAALDSLSPPERREEAGALGLWWVEHRPGDLESIARLLYTSGDPGRALPWIRKAIEHSLSLQSAESVERYLQWVRELSPHDPASIATRAAEEIAVARDLRRIGANRAALRVLRALTSVDLPGSVRRDRELALADVLGDMEVKEAESRLQRLEEEVNAAPLGEVSQTFRARVIGTRAYLEMAQGRFEAGRKAAEEALALLPLEGEGRERARDHFEAGWCSMELADWDAAERHFADALSTSRAHNFATLLSASLQGLAGLSYLLGDLLASQRYYEESIRNERDAGEVQRTIPNLLNLSEVAMSLGQTARAWTLHEEASRLADKFDLPQWRAGAAALKGELYARERKWAEAAQAFDLAAEINRAHPRRVRQTQIEIGRAWAKGELRDPSAGLRALLELEKDPEAISAQHGDYFLEVRARLKELAGDAAGARADLEAARGKTGPSPHRQARVLGDLATWEGIHGQSDRARELRNVADRLYSSSGVDASQARGINEVFSPPKVGAALVPQAPGSPAPPDRGGPSEPPPPPR